MKYQIKWITMTSQQGRSYIALVKAITLRRYKEHYIYVRMYI